MPKALLFSCSIEMAPQHPVKPHRSQEPNPYGTPRSSRAERKPPNRPRRLLWWVLLLWLHAASLVVFALVLLFDRWGVPPTAGFRASFLDALTELSRISVLTLFLYPTGFLLEGVWRRIWRSRPVHQLAIKVMVLALHAQVALALLARFGFLSEPNPLAAVLDVGLRAWTIAFAPLALILGGIVLFQRRATRK